MPLPHDQAIAAAERDWLKQALGVAKVIRDIYPHVRVWPLVVQDASILLRGPRLEPLEFPSPSNDHYQGPEIVA